MKIKIPILVGIILTVVLCFGIVSCSKASQNNEEVLHTTKVTEKKANSTPKEPQKELIKRGYDELGFEYTLLDSGDGYEVSQGKAVLDGVITIPEYFNDLPVKRIARFGFSIELKNTSITKDWETGVMCNGVTTGINLPAQLESIGEEAFSYCIKLEEIVIPDSVTKIEEAAFKVCVSLKRIVFPKGLKEIPQSCCSFTSLREIVFPENLEIIGRRAFSDTILSKNDPENLLSIVLPDTIKHIKDAAFHNMYNLENIIISTKNLESFEMNVFKNTLWYENQPDGLVFLEDLLYVYKGIMPQDFVIEIPSSVKKIAGGAFGLQDNLIEVFIPDGVKLIGSDVFSYCSNLTKVRLPQDIETIPENCFLYCEKLSDVSLPDSVSRIGERAFFKTCVEYLYSSDSNKSSM